MIPENPFIMVKPECRVSCSVLEQFFQQHNYAVTSKGLIPRWPSLVKQLYEPRSEYNRKELDAWVRATELLFPQHYRAGELWSLSKPGLTLIDQFIELNNMKREFRTLISPLKDLKAMINDGEQIPVYFTMIHVPDATIPAIEREYGLLHKHLESLNMECTYERR